MTTITLTGDAAEALLDWRNNPNKEIYTADGIRRILNRILAGISTPDPDEELAAEMCAKNCDGRGMHKAADEFRIGMNRDDILFITALMGIRAGREAAEKDRLK